MPWQARRGGGLARFFFSAPRARPYYRRVARRPRRSRLPLLLRLVALACAPLCALNLAVAACGRTAVFPLSPYFLGQKVDALRLFARHLPTCLLKGHEELGPLIAAAEKRHAIPEGLLAALVEVESGTRVHRISRAGAMGPGQLLPGTAAQLGVVDPFEPASAIDASARYLARQLARFKEVELALAAYNAGPGNVKGQVPRNGETEFYVAKVLAEYERRAPRAVAAKPGARPTARAGSRAPPTDRRAGPSR